MGKSTTTGTYEPQQYRHLPTVSPGIYFDGSKPCADAIVEWAAGKFLFDDFDRLCCFTPEGLRYVPERNTALLDIEGLPYSVRESVMGKCWVAVNGTASYAAPLTLERVRELAADAHATGDVGRLREIVDQLAAHCETVG